MLEKIVGSFNWNTEGAFNLIAGLVILAFSEKLSIRVVDFQYRVFKRRYSKLVGRVIFSFLGLCIMYYGIGLLFIHK